MSVSLELSPWPTFAAGEVTHRLRSAHDRSVGHVIEDPSFLFAIAGISGSLAGLAGLVAGLRRGADVRAMDLYRLREIVEFAFANVLLALSTIPLALIVGGASDALRIGAIAALVYSIVHVAVLWRRSRRDALPNSRAWFLGAVSLDLGILATVIATVVSGSMGAYEALLLVLLLRPMYAFLLVLASFESG
jgi:hypothetical protein